MPKRFEGHFKGFDGAELFYQTWTPDGATRGTVIVTHGLAEHSECYHPLAKTLADDGWLVYGWDLRGHGKSEGKRGYVKDVSQFKDDLEVFHKLVVKQSKSENLIFFGHSTGGMITIDFLESHDVPCTAAVLSSPALGLTAKVPKIKEALAHFAVKFLPTLTMHNEIKYSDLSHDEAMLKSYAADTLRHDKISSGLFLTMVENFPKLQAGAQKLKMPVLMQLAGDDRLVSTEAAREFFEKLPNKKNKLYTYAESFHEVYNDHERAEVIADLKKFINPYLGAGS